MEEFDLQKMHSWASQHSQEAIMALGDAVKMAIRGKKGALGAAVIRAAATDAEAPHLWTVPRPMRQTLPIFDRRLVADSVYEKNVDNYRRYLTELESANVLHIFGFRDLKSYVVEPFVLSWSPFNRNAVFLYPRSVMALLDRYEEVLELFFRHMGDRPLSRKAIMVRFAEFAYSRIKLLHPSLRDHFCEFDGSDPESYIVCSRKIVESLDPFAGSQYADYNYSLLPGFMKKAGLSGEAQEFSEIIPMSDRLTDKPKVQAATVSNWEVSLSKSGNQAEDLLDEELQVCSNPLHLLKCVERAVKRYQQNPVNAIMFSKYLAEHSAGMEIFAKLEEADRKSEDLIRAWANWFGAIKYKTVQEELEVPGASLLCEFGKSMDAFLTVWDSDLATVRAPEMPDTLLERLRRGYKAQSKRRCIFETCMQYGIPASYAYLCRRDGKDGANYSFDLVFSNFDDHIQDGPVKCRLQAMARTTLTHGGLRGPIRSNEALLEKIDGLMAAAGIGEWPPPDDAPMGNVANDFWLFIASVVPSK
jgi:hypothetical protein